MSLLGSLTSLGDIRDIDIDGTYLYATTRTGELHIVDISDPNHLVSVGTMDLYRGPKQIQARDGFVFIAEKTGLMVADVRNPEDPVPFCTSDVMSSAHGVDLSGDYAYVALANGALRVVDISSL